MIHKRSRGSQGENNTCITIETSLLIHSKEQNGLQISANKFWSLLMRTARNHFRPPTHPTEIPYPTLDSASVFYSNNNESFLLRGWFYKRHSHLVRITRRGSVNRAAKSLSIYGFFEFQRLIIDNSSQRLKMMVAFHIFPGASQKAWSPSRVRLLIGKINGEEGRLAYLHNWHPHCGPTPTPVCLTSRVKEN